MPIFKIDNARASRLCETGIESCIRTVAEISISVLLRGFFFRVLRF